MEFTTHFELHSQTTRLFEAYHKAPGIRVSVRGSHLYDALFQGTCTRSGAENTSLDYNSDAEGARLQI